jgi:hypothetical protein
VPKLSQQEEDPEEFRLHAEDLFAKYDPESALEEAAVITIARALWMKRTQSEFNSETRRLDEEIDTALGQLHKSKLIRKAWIIPNERCKTWALVAIISTTVSSNDQ